MCVRQGLDRCLRALQGSRDLLSIAFTGIDDEGDRAFAQIGISRGHGFRSAALRAIALIQQLADIFDSATQHGRPRGPERHAIPYGLASAHPATSITLQRHDVQDRIACTLLGKASVHLDCQAYAAVGRNDAAVDGG